VVTRTWTVKDARENMATCSQTINIIHNTAPAEVGGPVASSSTIQCISAATAPVNLPVVKDMCGVQLTAPTPVVASDPQNLVCEGKKTYTYTYSDCAGLQFVWTYTYTIDRTTAPIVPPAGASTVSCLSQAVPPLSPENPLLVQSEYTPWDCMFKTYMNGIVDQQQTVYYSPWRMEQNTGVGQSFTASVTDKLTQIDVNVWSFVGAPTFSVEVYQGNGKTGTPVYSASGYTVNTTGWVSLAIPVGSAPTLNAGSQYTFWLTAYPYNSVKLSLGNNPYAGGTSWDELPMAVEVKDVCGTVLTPTVAESGTYDGCEGTKIYTYTYTDCSGLSSNWVYTYTIEREDFTMPENAGSTIACLAEVKTPTPPTVTDNCGNNLTPAGPVISDDPTCEGTKTFTYTYMDCEGNTHDWVYTYTIESADFTMPADQGSEVTCVANAIAPTLPEVKDNCGNVLTPTGPTISTAPTCLGTMTYTYVYTDCEGNTHNWVYTYTITGLTVSGTVKYYDTSLTPMDVTVILNPGGHTTTTNSSGAFTFTGICSGDYEVTFSTTHTPGGINSTDAAQVNFWGVSPTTIEKTKFLAGDVDASLALSSNDAAAIQGYFLTAGGSGFTRSAWSFWIAGETISANSIAAGNPVITVGCTDVTKDFYGLVTGDFNGSFSGLKSAPRTLHLKDGESSLAGENVELDLPVVATLAMKVGAISLILDYPSDKVSVKGVYLGSDRTVPVQFATYGDEIRISWYSLNPMLVNAGETLLTLNVRTIGNATDEEIRFNLDPSALNELADNSYQVIRNASLQIGVIKSTSLPNGGKPLMGELTLTSYPNPFTNSTNFAYTLPDKGKVVLEVRDLLGRMVKEQVVQSQIAGNHVITMDANSMTSGLYYATIRLISDDNKVSSQTIKIVNTK
jgi:hypothetical protein